jgi:hypothetical protein
VHNGESFSTTGGDCSNCQSIVGGIIGILGSIASMIIGNIFRNQGKLIVFTNKSKASFQKRDSMGGTVEALDRSDAKQ